MFGRRNGHHKNPSDTLFRGLKRGIHGKPPLATVSHFPSAESIAKDSSLSFDIKDNRQAKFFCGLVHAAMKQREGVRYASGGDLVGVVDDRAVCSVASSRFGKGRSWILPNAYTWPGSAIFIDPKGDIATETILHRNTVLNQECYLLDAFGVSDSSAASYRTSFNPLSVRLGDDDDDLLDLAILIAESLVVRFNEREPHWNDAAQHFLEGVVGHVLTDARYEGRRTLNTVYQLVMLYAEDGDKESPSTLESEMIGNGALDSAIQASATAFYDKEDKERSSVLSTLRRHLHFLGYPKIKKVLEDGPFTFRDMHTRPTSLYVSLPATKLVACSGLMRLVVNLSLASFEAGEHRRDFQHQKGRASVLMCIDEAFSLGRMERLEVAAGMISGFGVKLWTIWQDLSQMQSTYPKCWQTLLGNAGLQMFGAPNDLATLEWIEKRLGQTLVYNPSHHDPTYEQAIGGGATGDGFSLGSHPLMSVSEIAHTFDRDDPFHRQLVITPTHGPMILQRALYDQHEAFRGMSR